MSEENIKIGLISLAASVAVYFLATKAAKIKWAWWLRIIISIGAAAIVNGTANVIIGGVGDMPPIMAVIASMVLMLVTCATITTYLRSGGSRVGMEKGIEVAVYYTAGQFILAII